MIIMVRGQDSDKDPNSDLSILVALVFGLTRLYDRPGIDNGAVGRSIASLVAVQDRMQTGPGLRWIDCINVQKAHKVQVKITKASVTRDWGAHAWAAVNLLRINSISLGM